MAADLQSTSLERFFLDFEQVIQRNDVDAAGKIAERIKAIFGPQPMNSEKSPVFTLPLFHQRVVSVLSNADNAAAAKMRNLLSRYYFTGNWLNKRELCEQVGDPRVAEAFYYHATSLDGLQAILSKGKITANQSTHYGAFVSEDFPSWKFGDCAIALKKNVERFYCLSTFTRKDPTNGIGFFEDIKVNKTTISHVIILQRRRNNFLSVGKLTKLCRKWAGFNIFVLSAFEAEKFIEKTRSLNLGVPIEWGRMVYFSRGAPGHPLIKPEWRDSPFLPSKL